MSDQEQADLIKQVHQIDFAAALRHEQEQAASRLADIQFMPPWILVVVWISIGAILFGGGMFAGWLGWHH